MTKRTQKEQVIAVLVDLSTENHRDHAVKFVAHRDYDRLLCDHVYHGFCPDCPQIKCERRRV